VDFFIGVQKRTESSPKEQKEIQATTNLRNLIFMGD
jgi:hypothetical protein